MDKSQREYENEIENVIILNEKSGIGRPPKGTQRCKNEVPKGKGRLTTKVLEKNLVLRCSRKKNIYIEIFVVKQWW